MPLNSSYKYLSLTDKHRRYIKASSLTGHIPEKSLASENTKQFVHGSYKTLLFDPQWKAKRNEILTRDQQKCIICQSQDNLHVHHRQYHFDTQLGKFKPPWDYSNHLLITLCERCHQRGHKKYKVPTIKF
ncbi:hypothetical protein Cpin_0027 [Chitinophaga pinensis DSM 2588]|uniref:HNH endonuclease n=1 Tax=Chitinophaga pinensis (strain ATCC 43595 / DSM 2588 / LMG 13176 / NBRC 15968 / NCIMB 11800 / UQM 2034) TaxID=485918 RepID=A0A979FYN0_CHIPD|nr:hypothetical protein Cpin_0027 [Chitinophaga pinensis DSM 2588]